MPRCHGWGKLVPGAARTSIVLVCLFVLFPAAMTAARRRHHRSGGHRHHAGHGHHRGRSHRQLAARAADEDEGAHGSTEEHLHLRRGDTLEAILAARGVGPSEASPWFDAAAGVYDLRTVRPRHGITLRFDRAARALQEIRYEIDDHAMLVVEVAGDRIAARREALPYVTEVKGVAGRVERGFREDALEAGIPESIVAGLGDIFAWDVDVENGLQPGDQFRVLYENLWGAGEGAGEPGSIIGASIVTGGRTVTGIYFEDQDGRGGYYRPSGDALSRVFLRYPVNFTEITSEFSLLRLHPILHRERPHFGVDFAAPRGTPVRATASGTVNSSGWVGGLGRCVRIDHPDGLTSIYGHLSEVAMGVDVGSTIERGQVIGYVGSSGLATGPHLHYALERDGLYVDPLTLNPSSEQAVPGSARRAFERAEREVLKQLAVLPETSRPQAVSLSRVAFPSPADPRE